MNESANRVSTLRGLLWYDARYKDRLADRYKEGKILDSQISDSLWRISNPEVLPDKRKHHMWIMHNSASFDLKASGFPLLRRFHSHGKSSDTLAPVKFADAFRSLKAYSDYFNPHLPIMMPDPILANQPQHSWNLYGMLVTKENSPMAKLIEDDKIRSLARAAARSELAPKKPFLLGRAWHTIVMGRTVANGVAVSLDDDDLEAAFDQMVRTPAPIEVYVRGLVAMDRKDWQVGTVSMFKTRLDVGSPPANNFPTTPSWEELLYLQYISYACALQLAARDVLLVLMALKRRGSTLSALASQDTLRMYPSEADKERVNLVHATERNVAGLPVDGPRHYLDRGPSWALQSALGNYHTSIMEIYHPLAHFDRIFDPTHRGVAAAPESDDVTTDEVDDLNTGGRYSRKRSSLILTGTDFLIEKMETLYQMIQSRLDEPIGQSFTVQMEKESRYVAVAEVSVWPFNVDNEGNRVYLSNPIPPIVENVYIPTISFDE